MSDRSKGMALTLTRCVLGATALMHGLHNTFGLFSGPGLTAFLAEMNGRVAVAGDVTGYTVAIGQLLGGLSLLLGPMAKVTGWLFLVFVAGNLFVTARYQAFFLDDGCEYLLGLMAMSAIIATHGPGAYHIQIKRGDKG